MSDFSAVGGIWIMRRDAAGTWSAPVKRLSRGFVHAWSLDGKWIAVATGRSIYGGFNNERLELITPDGDSAFTLYAVADTLTDPTVGDPHWSRDNKGLYFKANDALGRASLWYIPVTGGRPRLLVRFDDPMRPSLRFNYTTDGRRFFFTINDRQSDVWVAEIK
jgi:Tol biopolymer transport system component